MSITQSNDSRRSAILRRILIYTPIFFLFGIAQCSFFTELSFISAVPNIVMGTVAAIAFLDSQRSAVICALASGFMIDALGSSGISLSPIAFLAVVLVSSEIAKKILPTFISWLIIILPSAIINSIFTVIRILLITKDLQIVSIFRVILLPELILTIIFSLPIFFIIKICIRFADKKSKFKL